jgi:hypothetical protein
MSGCLWQIRPIRLVLYNMLDNGPSHHDIPLSLLSYTSLGDHGLFYFA